ncbi:hypothetical protein FQN57_001003 [Myotisia sp. PD_48]|nr:hypothetical protein FQN57_001003 [Myotisia sp. PD_48]
MDMGGDKCSMNMLFTFSTKNLCIIFHQWHITGPFSLLFSLLAIVVLTAGYEALRDYTRRYERSFASAQKDSYLGGTAADPEQVEGLEPSHVPNTFNDTGINDEASSLLFPARNLRGTPAERKSKLIRAGLYALQVFYSFFIMLLFMTYNGWVMLAVAAGAFVGYLFFGDDTAAKSVSCH